MFDRDRVKLLRTQLAAHLKELAYKLDVDITLGRATFTHNNVTFKMEIAKIGDDGEVESRSVDDFKRCAFMYGLKPEDLGRSFMMNCKPYKIVGLKPRRSKYPIICECYGKSYKVGADVVKSLLR